MTDLGKVDRAFFERVLYPALGADREDVTVGPRHGVDFGVVDVGGRALVTATDPLSLLPALGDERAGRLAVEVILTDVAVSGIAPSHLSVSLAVPRGWSDDDLAGAWRGIAEHAECLGVSVVAAHVGRSPGVDSSWVGSATAFGVGSHDALVRPDGARPGDRLIVSTGPAAEVAGLFSVLFGGELDLPASDLAAARERIEDIAAVADARAAFEAGGVTAMHDATEGGLQGALVEMAEGAGVRFDVERERVPVADGVFPVCAAIDVDPWCVTSCGTLVIVVTSDRADGVVEALERRGTPAAAVGRVTSGEGVYVDGERVEHPEVDPSWEAYRRFAGE
jgi:hydrogenase expression/formation protein HypE